MSESDRMLSLEDDSGQPALKNLWRNFETAITRPRHKFQTEVETYTDGRRLTSVKLPMNEAQYVMDEAYLGADMLVSAYFSAADTLTEIIVDCSLYGQTPDASSAINLRYWLEKNGKSYNLKRWPVEMEWDDNFRPPSWDQNSDGTTTGRMVKPFNELYETASQLIDNDDVGLLERLVEVLV